MTLQAFNFSALPEATELLTACCGSRNWVEGMLQKRPFKTPDDLFQTAESIWLGLGECDWLEAFTHHPKIGDLDALRTKFASTAALAGQEQAGASGAAEQILQSLKSANASYEKKFGFIFIVCATGKSAKQMLDILTGRLYGSRANELKTAAAEQAKITRLRLEKLVQPGGPL